ncbi:MAG TPA: Uma2 family endonuclease [Gemmataceae bacterium]|nr:Uma2 family endonuclease [Gemmataceae bacterium]
MTTATATARMTADEFYEWCNRPENAERWFELVRGEVIELPPPTKIHGVVSANVAGHLWMYSRQQRKGYITTNDAGTLLERDPDTVRGPDVAYFTDAQAFGDLHPKYGEHPPVLAVEVLSPEDRVNRVLGKIDDYLNNGVRVVWLIDPEERTVRVIRPAQPPATLTSDQEIDGGDVLPGFRCPVRDFFLLPEDPPPAPKAADAPPAR